MGRLYEIREGSPETRSSVQETAAVRSSFRGEKFKSEDREEGGTFVNSAGHPSFPNALEDEWPAEERSLVVSPSRLSRE